MSQWIASTVEEGRWRTLRASRSDISISHLSFADDALLFAEASKEQVKCIKDGLHKFCKASGQSINLNKSPVYFSPNVSEEVAASLSNRLSFQRTREFGCYLGHQIIHQRRSKEAHEKLLQRLRDRLEGWKSKCLSRIGRITHAQSVLNSMEVFQM